MSEKKEFIIDVINQVRETVELFYQQRRAEALEQFEPLLEKILTMIDILFEYHSENETFPLDEEKIQESLQEALQALQDGDLVLLADILQYDFAEYIEELLENMQ